MPTEYNDTNLEQDETEITAKEAAKILCLSPLTLKKWRCTNEQPDLPWRKRFHKIYYLKSDVINFKSMKTIKSQAYKGEI